MTRAVGEPIIRTRRWTRREYDRLIELGVLHEDEPIELLAGRLAVREPQRTPHAVATQLVAEALRAAFGAGWSVRVQLPLALDEESEPDPDVAVVRGAPRDYLREHPSVPGLVVEVAHDSLRADRTLKARLYARAAIADSSDRRRRPLALRRPTEARPPGRVR